MIVSNNGKQSAMIVKDRETKSGEMISLISLSKNVICVAYLCLTFQIHLNLKSESKNLPTVVATMRTKVKILI